MSDPRPIHELSDESAEEAWNVRVQELGQRFGFPPTPDITGAVRQRLGRRQGRLSPNWVRAGIALVIVVLVIVLAVPDLRAKAFDFFGIGAVRILRDEPDTSSLDTGFDPTYQTTLDDAQQQVNYPIRQPAYPPDLGSPDAVYLYPNDMVILVWADGLPLSLTLIDSRQMVYKHYADQEIVTTVNGHEALWLVKPHVIEAPRTDAPHIERLVEHNVLLWKVDDITYRLETDLTLDEARRIAESVPER
jgi:hypothetical protein